MLLLLHIENYAVIDRVEVEFGEGLNLLTGETGAGKSILIGALGLLLGERASAEMVRHGAEKTVVWATLENSKAAAEVLEQNGIEAADEIILRRETTSGGKGRVVVNNQPATVAVLKQLAPYLATVHAQNESLLSFDAAERLRLLDEFAALDTSKLTQAYAAYRELERRIGELEGGEQDRLRLLDLWLFQSKEIEQARLEHGEDQRLEAEKRVLANAEKLYAAAMSAHELLYESGTSAASSLRAAEKLIEELSRYDPEFKEQLEALQSARITVEDAGTRLRDYAGSINASPERLAELEDRLALIERLKRKYGPSLEEVMAFGEEVKRKLHQVEHRDEALAELRVQLKQAAEEYLALAHAASKKRTEGARKLEKLVESEINTLAMKAQFHIALSKDENPAGWRASGVDTAEFLIATNPGEPMLPVEKIASGGELSRVMLALKASIEAGAGREKRRGGAAKTAIFDEIDSGIGGRAAEAVGKKLKALSQAQQVICITHLPQIACFADQHYVIEKTEQRQNGEVRAHTRVRRLQPPERAQELARMLSGATVTETSLKHAQQLLKAQG